MMELYAKSRITKSKAEILIKASDIIIDANAAARKWTEQQIAMRKSFERAVIKSRVIGYSE